MEVETFEDESVDEDDLEKDVILGIQAMKKPPTRVISNVEKMKWSSVSWPSSLFDAVNRIRDIAKAKTKVTIDSFWATQSMLPLIPTPRIVQID